MATPPVRITPDFAANGPPTKEQREALLRLIREWERAQIRANRATMWANSVAIVATVMAVLFIVACRLFSK